LDEFRTKTDILKGAFFEFLGELESRLFTAWLNLENSGKRKIGHQRQQDSVKLQK
jgi:hypothetical protein